MRGKRPTYRELQERVRALEKETIKGKLAEEALRESEENYRSIFDAANDAIFMHDIKTGKIIDVNQKIFEMFSYTPEEARHLTIDAFSAGVPPYTQKDAVKWIRKAAAAGPQLFEWHAKDKTGRLFWIEVNLKLTVIGGKKRVLAVICDITERKRAEESLRESEEQYRRIIETAFEGIWIIDTDNKAVFVNRRMADMLGYPAGEILGRSIMEFIPEETRTRTEYYLERSLLGIKEQWDGRVICKDGKELWAIISASPILDSEGRYAGSLQMFTDITERKLAEEKIQLSLREKEALLQEIYHRVKNNLQVISSLLNLKSRALRDKTEAGVFEDCRNFVKAMTLVQEKLYHSEDLARINYKEYIRDLVKDLVQAYHTPRPVKISLEFDLEEIFLGKNSAVPCGLVLNELIANSLKHAFPEAGTGVIKVSLHAVRENTIELVVSDNGIGISRHEDINKSGSIGLMLVKGLVENQLQGKIEFSGKEGTEVRITFKEEKL